MRAQIYLVVIGFFLSFSQILHAAELTTPNSFQSGEPALASEVNQNFQAVSDAVNDNNERILTNEQTAVSARDGVVDNTAAISDANNRISANESSIMTANTRILGARAGVGSNRLLINDNSLDINDNSADINSVERDIYFLNDLRANLRAGSVVLQAREFQVIDNSGNNSGGCGSQVTAFSRSIYGGSTCALFTDVHLPHGSRVTRMECYVRDNDNRGRLLVHLWPRGFRISNSNITLRLFELSTNAAQASNSRQLIFAGRGSYPSTPDASYIVRNDLYHYRVWVDIRDAVIPRGNSLELFTCSIRYAYDDPPPIRN